MWAYTADEMETLYGATDNRRDEMFEYPYFADAVGATVKSMFGAMITETEHKANFNKLIDAKVQLNKDIYEASKNWLDSMQKLNKGVSQDTWTKFWSSQFTK